MTANNCLLANVSYLLDGSSQSGPATMFLTHCTVTNATKLIGPGTGLSVNVTAKNSIFSDVDAWGTPGYFTVGGYYNGFHANVPAAFGGYQRTSAASPFQAGGAGHYYLKSDSPFRGAGTTTVGSTLLNQLKTRTTQPPIDFPTYMTISGELTLFPQIPRYVSGPPDLGYWYDALDFTAGVLISDGATITVQPGTAIGLRNDYNAAFVMWKGSYFISRGAPDRPNTFAAVHLVQEGPYQYPFFDGLVAFLPDGYDPPPVFDFRFSNFYLLPSQYHFWGGWGDVEPVHMSPSSALDLTMADCSVRGGRFNLGRPQTCVYDQGIWYCPFENVPASVTWVNNVWDRVAINLDPDHVGQPMTIDLAFKAYNNLFRGGEWFRLVPIPATAGNWLLKDNLFDNVEILQSPTQPIEHDYNAYCPVTAFPWGGTARLTPDATNDRVLTASPVYQTGPLGDFYLTNSSPLYNTDKRGSRTVADAGLYHYTTRYDQLKDGAQSGNAIIGRHYVATTSSSTNRPKDSETPIPDGVPDYVEDANGNNDANDVAAGIETSPSLTETTSGTPDSRNTIYDDIDLDGDAMVGRIEKALNPSNPQTLVWDPLKLTQEASGEEPDVLNFKLWTQGLPALPINYDFLSGIGLAKFWLDGDSGPELQGLEENTSDGSTLLVWRTGYDYPGTHFLQPKLYLNTADFNSSSQPMTSAAGFVQPATTDNILKFDPFYSDFDTSGATIFAELAFLDANYEIVLHDPSSPTGPPVTTITGTTATGEIREDWYLTDERTGSAYAGTQVNVAVTVTPPSSPSQTRKSELNAVPLGFDDGDFTVAFSWHSMAAPGQPVWNCIQAGVVNPLLQPSTVTYQNPFRYPHTFNVDSISATPQNPSRPGLLSTENDMNLLLENLGLLAGQSGKHTRDFFWCGHGSEFGLGGPSPLPVQTALEFGNRIGNFWGAINRDHPYRFVMMYSCYAAKDTLWARAFGIRKTITWEQLSQRPERAQAFLGWEGKIAAFDNPNSQQAAEEAEWLRETLQFFFVQWQSNRSLYDIVRACSRPGNPGPVWDPSGLLDIKFPLGAMRAQDLNPAAKYTPIALDLMSNPKGMRIYGYPGLTRNAWVPFP